MAEEQNNHSLKMQIEADFGIANNSATDFEKKMAEINTIVDNLSKNIAGIRSASTDVDKAIKEQLDKLHKKFKDNTFMLEGTSITQAIEKRIADAINSSGIVIKDIGKPDEGIGITLNDQATTSLRNSIAESLVELVKDMKITGIARNKFNIPINNESIVSIQKRFNEKMLETLEKNVQFVTPKDSELSLIIDEKNYQTLLDNVKAEFIKILNNPALVQVDQKSLSPIVVSSSYLEKALENIKNAVGNIDAEFAPGVLKQIEELPNVKEKIKAFQQHTGALFTELEETIDAIDKLEPNNKNYGRLKYEAGRMRNMLIAAATDIIRDTTNMFEQTMNIKEGNKELVKEIVTDLGAVQSQINNFIKKMADESTLALLQELAIARKTVDGKETFVPSVQKMQETIAKAASEALKGINGSNLKIDVAQVSQLFDAWAVSTTQHLMANSTQTLSELQASLLSKNKTVLDAYVRSLEKLATLDFTPLTGKNAEPISVKVDTPNVRNQIKTHLESLVSKFTENVTFTTGAAKAVENGLSLNKTQTANIQKAVAEILEGQLKQLSTQLSNRVGKDFDATLLEKFDNAVFNEAKNLVSTMVDQANNISRAITDGVNSSSFSKLSTAEQNEIEERFREAGDKLVKDFAGLMDNALGSFVITSAITEEVKDKLRNELNNLAKQTELSFDDEKTPIVLHGLVADVQRKLQSAIKANVELWQPDLSKFSLDVDFKSVFDNINKLLSTHLNNVSNDIIKMVDEQAKPAQYQRQQLVELKREDDTWVTKTPKRLTGSDLVRLKEQGFGAGVKGENGYEYTLQDKSKFSEDELAMLLSQLNTKFNEMAQKKAEKVREVNVDISKQKIVATLEPIRSAILTYLSLYVKAVGDAVTSIKPSVDGAKLNAELGKKIQATVNTVCSATSKAVESAIDDLSKHTAEAVKAIQSQANEKPKLDVKQVIKSADLHGEVRKWFAKQYDMLVKDWQKANPTFEGAEGVTKVLEANVQVIMNKFHETVTDQTRDAIALYVDELKRLKADPNTEGVNYLAKALEDIQNAFNEKVREFIQSQVAMMAQAISGLNFKGVSIGANMQQLVQNAQAQQAQGNVRPPVNYGNGLPFPEFEDEDDKEKPRSVGFYERPGQSEWFSNIFEQFDDDWGRINSWVNQRLLDGLNAKTAVHGKVDGDLERHLVDYIDNHFVPSVKAVATMPYSPEDTDTAKAVRAEMQRIIDDFKLATSWIKNLTGQDKKLTTDEAFSIQQDSLRQQLNSIRNKGIVPDSEINSLSSLIDAATVPNDLKRVRVEMSKIRELQREITEAKKEEEAERKKGELLTQNESLKTNVVLQTELLQAILRQVPALQSYNLEQARINNATNTWSARLRDAEGNVRSLQGTVDRATGSLYQHSEAVSKLNSQSAKLVTASSQKYSGGARAVQNTYYPTAIPTSSGSEYNPNGDFSSSVFNTMRYMTAGAIMGYPSMMMWQAWEANKEFDYQMERARQNFVIKGDLSPENRMSDVAHERTQFKNPELDVNSSEYTELYEKERQRLIELAGDEGNVAKEKVQNLAIKYRLDIDKAAQAYHISSRLLEDPNEAFAMTEAVVKANSIEEMDIETGTKGMEAIKSQWGIKGTDYEEVINMMIMAANYTPATVEDILATQQRSGSIFKQALPNMTKRDAISTSIALSAMFNQATARSGSEGGTFFKTILQSPFTKKGANTLQNYALQSGFEDLNPYNEDGSQKDFVSVFSSIMEHSMKMDTKSKRELWANIFPQWHQGSAGAIESFMNEMVKEMQSTMDRVETASGKEADTDGDGQISVKEAFEEYFKNVANSNPEAIEEMMAGNAQTWPQQVQLLNTTWQAATSGVFDELKDEFGMLSVYLTALMRAVRENTATVAGVISIGSKIAMGLGMRFAFNKIREKVRESSDNKKAEKFENVGGLLFEERRAHNLKKIAISDEIAMNEARRMELGRNKQNILNELNNVSPELTTKKSARDNKRNELDELLVRKTVGGEQLDVEIERATAEYNELAVATAQLENKQRQLRTQLANVEQDEKELADETTRLNNEFNEQVRSINSVNNRIDALADAMDDLGLDSSNMRRQVEKLHEEFKTGEMTVSSYEQQISDLANRSGLSQQNLQKLRQEVDRVNQEFEQGTIDAQQYAKAIQQLEKAHKLGVDGINGGGVANAGTVGQSGFGLMEMIVASSLLTGGISMKRGIFDRIKDVKATGSIRNFFGRGRKMTDEDGNTYYEGDKLAEERNRTKQQPKDDKKWYQKGVLGKIGGVTDKIGDIKGLGTALKLGKALSWTAILGEVATKGFDLVSAVGMEDFEKSEAQAQKLDDLTLQADRLRNGGIGEKLVSGINFAGDLTFGALNNLLGGNEASFGQVWNALSTAVTTDSGDKVKDKLTEDFNTKALREEANKLRDEHLQKVDPDYEPLDSAMDDLTNAISEEEQALTDLTEAVGELNSTMNRQLSMNDAQYTIDSTKLLLSGVSEDSQQMRDLQNKLLSENNAVLQESLSDIESKMATVSDKESSVYKDLELQKKQIEAQISSNNYSKHQNQMSEYDEIMNRLSEELAATEDEYGIQEAQAQLSGADSDSPVMKKIESAKAEESNQSIEKAQTDLQNLASKLGLKENSSDYLKIQNTIRDLEQQQLDNLVAIKSNLDKSQGTFNLPSGVKVVDYMSHMMSGNTHKNVTARSGDTVVNVTIGNMSGNTNDVQKMTDSIAQAVKQANQQSASNFNKQVWAGMGTNYTSPY